MHWTAIATKDLSTVCTQVLLLLDVDFMVSHSLNELQHSNWLQTAVSKSVLIVIPAFEPVMSDVAAQRDVLKACQGMVSI